AAVREADFRRRRARVAIASAERVHDDVSAGRQRVSVPAAAKQRARSAAFDAPALDLAVDGSIEVDPRVRVDPLELHDLAFETDRLVAVKLGGKRVVCNGSAGSPQGEDGADRGGSPLLHLHGYLLLKLLFADHLLFCGSSGRSRVFFQQVTV